MAMTGEMGRMIRGGISGAFLGGFSGSVLGFIGTLMVGIEPVAFLVCGVYAGVVCGGIVGAITAARSQRLQRKAASTPNHRRGLVCGQLLVRSHSRWSR